MSLSSSLKSRSFSRQQMPEKSKRYPFVKLPSFLTSQITTRQSFRVKQNKNIISFRRKRSNLDIQRLSSLLQQNQKIFRNSTGFKYPNQASLKRKNITMNVLLSKNVKNEDLIESKQKVIIGRYCSNYQIVRNKFEAWQGNKKPESSLN